MRIVALYGRSNCGKSSSLNVLREMLRCEGTSLAKVPQSGDQPEAFIVRGKVVCVAPGGDTRDRVEENLAFFVSNNCEIGFTASRTKMGPVNALEEFQEGTNCALDWFPKSYETGLSEDTMELCNRETAELLKARI